MEIKELDPSQIRAAFLSGAAELSSKKDYINELNVFPVPDGDTGTNMTLTIMTAARDVKALENPDMHTLCKTISSGSLRGARGNSGVILSQLLRGFTRELDADGEIVNVKKLTAALARATETAYKAVMRPKEGTILTVARAMSEKAAKIQDKEENILTFAEQVIQAGEEALANTPELLPVLKQAGVVDSGGKGLMAVMEGCYRALSGEAGEPAIELDALTSGEPSEPHHVDVSALETSNIRYGYCTEFLVNLEKPFPEEEERKFKSYLESIGDSIVCVASDDIVKVHVHTNDPGLAIQKGLSYGSLSRMKIDNMREEHHERLIRNASEIAAAEKKKEAEEAAKPAERKQYGFIAVSCGEGLDEIFREIGVDVLISGGQTMNPSTEDILNAIQKVNADTVFVLPNNKNIILAAEQARDLTKDRQVIVVPTKNIPQGISAMVSFMPGSSAEENLQNMEDACGALHSAEITYAVRGTNIDGFEIHEGDYMAIGDHGMLTVRKDLGETVLDAVSKIADDSTELVTLYYGESVKKEDAEKLTASLQEEFQNTEIELNYGGQPVYYYFLSAE